MTLFVKKFPYSKLFVLVFFFSLCNVFILASGGGNGLKEVSPKAVGMDKDRLEVIDELIQASIDSNKIPGAVTLVARNGKIAQWEAYGKRDIANDLPMEKDTIFRIFSLTKPVTAVAVLQLYEQGYFQLNDPVKNWIPAFADPQVIVECDSSDPQCTNGSYYTVPASRDITIKDLLTHTSGLEYIFRSRPIITQIYQEAGIVDGLASHTGTVGDMVNTLATLPLYFNPGEKWDYSLSYDVLGYLVEVVSGKSFDQYCQDHIFEPLDMEDTHFYLPQDKVSRLSKAYKPDGAGGITEIPDGNQTLGNILYAADFHYNGPQTYFSGGAGLVSTAGDYARFLMMLAKGGKFGGERVLSPKTIDYMRINQVGDLPSPDFPTYEGYKYGIGGATHVSPRESGRMSSKGEFIWGGLFYTLFQWDKEEDVFSLIFTQTFPSQDGLLRNHFQSIVNSAIEDSKSTMPID